MSKYILINEQIHHLIRQGLDEIRQHLKEKGSLTAIDEDNEWSAYYINDDGYAESAYYREIELEDNGKIAVLLSDGFWLYEEDLTVIHVMDILTIFAESYISARIEGEGDSDQIWLQCADTNHSNYLKEFHIPSSDLQNVKCRWADEGTEGTDEEQFQILFECKKSGDSYWCNAQSIDFK